MQKTGREGSALRSPAAWVRFLAIIAAGTALDLATKHWAYYALEHPATKWSQQDIAGLQRRLLCLELVWQPNWGAVFGFGHGETAKFVALTFVALGLLTFLFVDSKKNQVWLQTFVACVAAGALGNLYDRLMFGHVRDFLRLAFRADWAPWGGPHGYLWPYIFNIADVLITVGVAGLLLVWLIAVIRHGRRKSAEASRKG